MLTGNEGHQARCTDCIRKSHHAVRFPVRDYIRRNKNTASATEWHTRPARVRNILQSSLGGIFETNYIRGLLSIYDQMAKIEKKRLIGRLFHVRHDRDRLDIAKDGLASIIQCFMVSVLHISLISILITYYTFSLNALSVQRLRYPLSQR